MSVHWIGYTTLYRDGGPELARAAATLAREMVERRGIPAAAVRLERIESKRDFVDAMARIASAGETLGELHFFGHSGMYGPMFRTTAMPEQFSPYEWRTLQLPFAPGGGGQAFFHACRTARWFAPFFARTFGVAASGYHWYTTFSSAPDRFVWPGLKSVEAPLYLIGCRGKKSDGLVGSVMKYAGRMPVEVMKRFEPTPVEGDASYDGVAALYDEVFADIRVRRDEWAWLSAHWPERSGGGGAGSPARALAGHAGPSRTGLRVLDIGCGNGALLRALAPRFAAGVGVDTSPGMIARAVAHGDAGGKLRFAAIDGPRLPFPDASFDVVTSLLSFRYLDWDPIMNEIRRVLAPGGRLLVVDMVTAPVEPKEMPRFVIDSARAALERRTNTRYGAALARLTADPRWQTMLAYNPIRAQHEYVWYFESRFPGRHVEKLNIGWHNRVLAFDSGPLEPGTVAPQTYP